VDGNFDFHAQNDGIRVAAISDEAAATRMSASWHFSSSTMLSHRGSGK